MPTRKYLDETGLEKTLEEIRDHMPDISTKQDIFQYNVMPTANVDYLNKIIQFVGSTNGTYTNGFFYKCISDGQDPATYSWTTIGTKAGALWGNITGTLSNQTDLVAALNGKQDIIQVSTMPTASIDTLNNIVQYIGTTDSTYTNGFFYKGISTTEEIEGVETTTYSWKQIDVSSNLVTLSYGHSTWQDFIDAYNAGKIVYCKAGSGVDPSTGAQRRMAFMAYINVNGSTLTSVEFQYYRSIGPHTASQQGDQVIRYLLNSSNGGTWTVDTRETSTKIVAGTGLTSTYSNGTITLNATGGAKYVINIEYTNFNDRIFSNYNTEDNRSVFQQIYNNYSNIKAGDVIVAVKYNNTIEIIYNVEQINLRSNQLRISLRDINTSGSTGMYNVWYRSYIVNDFYSNFSNDVVGNIENYRGVQYIPVNNESILGVNNTTAYTPTGDYNPATKKYVDDNIPDVSNFITNTVNNLTNYYLKTETYTKTEVDNLISAVSSLDIQVVQTLPVTDISTSTIYLVPKSSSQTQNVYDEYIYVSDGASTPTYSWEKIGDTEIDLSDYVTITDLNTALADYTTTTDLTTLLSGKQDTIDSSHKISADLVDDSSATNKFVTASDKTAWDNKYDKPSGGIPDTDLSSSVQTSLGKADTALQSETDPVFSASAASGITSSDITNWNNKSDFSGSYNDLTDKPTIPDELSDLADDSTHRLVTDTEKSTWSGKQDIIQYSTMPTPASTTVGKIVQYIGTTNLDYTQGHFYIGVIDGESAPTYNWDEIDVQDHQDISGKENISNKVTSLSSSSTDTQYPSAKCVYDAIPNIEACTNSDIDGLFNS